MAAESFGALLRQRRQLASLSQEALAERAGISGAAVAALESGRRSMPRLETVQRLAAALDLDDEARRQLFAAATLSREPASPAADQEGQPPGPDASLPDGMRAFLIADVRGYTAFTHEHGDEAGANLAIRFAALAQEAVAGHEGQVVEVRGDEVLAVFTSARKALRAAADLLARCAAASSPQLPLRAGVGLDVGEPVPVAGGYRGEAINVAARLCALAAPGEILATESMVHLARLIEGLAYEERGELALKGISRPVRAWLVREGSMPSGAQPARGAPARPAAPRHNLPAALSSFIGREREQARALELLRGARVVTLTGAGGVGKTRLATAVAEAALGDYRDGVWLVELAPLAATLVPEAVAQALGLSEQRGQSTLDLLKEHLRERRLLLVLDNCEHVIDACARLVSELLRACPDLRILATSREVLGVNGEQRYRVPSLAAPGAGQAPPDAPVESYEAVRLFVARARERRPDFALTAQNAPSVAEICRRLDGIPLAIELAAARVGSMSVEQIAARLDDRFRLLTGGARTAQPRQQTLRAVLDWGHDLLADPERALLRRLSVFAGGWTLEAAEYVCAGGEVSEWDVLDLLGQLDSKSLVLSDQRDAEVRFGLLETVRQYAREKLLASGEEVATADRHLEWCLGLAELAEPSLVGPDHRQWLARLEQEHDNLRAGLCWALAPDGGERAARGLRLAAALWRFWYMRGHFREGRSLLEQALARAGGDAEARAVRAKALHGAGVLAYSQGDYVAARSLCEDSLALHQDLGDRPGVAVALNILGNVAVSLGDYDRAVALSEQSLALHRELGSARGIAVALNNLGHVLLDRGDDAGADGPPYARIEELFTESLGLSRTLGDNRGIAIALVNLGEVALRRHDHARAAACGEESLALLRDLGDRWGTGAALNTLAQVAYEQGDLERAARQYAECLALRHELGDRIGIAECLVGLAGVACRTGEPARAAHLCGAVAALCAISDAPLPPVARAIFEHTRAESRSALPEDAFAAAWQDGSTQPIDAAIAGAIAGTRSADIPAPAAPQ